MTSMTLRAATAALLLASGTARGQATSAPVLKAPVRHLATVDGYVDSFDRAQSLDARHDGAWELPVLGAITAPIAVSIRPDGPG